jgi:Fe-S-cluster containining protein
VSYDCRACGACCHSPWTGDGYVRLYEVDLQRLRSTKLPVIQQVQGGDPGDVIPKLGTRVDESDGRVCVAFEGRAGHTCGCTIYHRRPQACRQLEPGSAGCREARVRMGMPQ